MSSQIWKFPIRCEDLNEVSMPVGARLLTVQVQGSAPCLWAEVETCLPKRLRLIHVRGTGHDMDYAAGCPYVGSFQLLAGQLVFHVLDGGWK